MQTDPKLLIKFPTRGRPDKFFSTLDQYISKAKDLNKIGFLISLDDDDKTMNNETVISRLNSYLDKGIKIAWIFGHSKTKIEAINANIDQVSGWDILLLASDDMVPVCEGYDYIIRKDMNDHFRDMDGVLWYSDGGQNNINTLSIMGREYYKRFGYIYHPSYISLWCDNEFTDISLQLNKCYRSDKVIIEHQHPVYQKTNYDELYIKNESYYHIDAETYKKRKEINFGLEKSPIKFSVLLLGIPNRISNLSILLDKLNTQIDKNGLQKEIEILALVDNKTRTVGSKRQSLLDIAQGQFIAYIDDDDDISDDYILEIYNKIVENPNVDVITFEQSVHINDNPPSKVIFSLDYDNEEYYPGTVIKRKPFHMCVWNSEIARQVRFPNISKTEDWFWLEQLCKKAKKEANISKILHYYIYKNGITTAYD